MRIGTRRPLRAGSLDGTLIRVPGTPANRAFFGSAGTGDDSSPFPQARALPMTCCPCRALFAMPHGPAGTGKAESEQALLDEAMDRYPALFDPGWIWLMGRNYHGARRIAAMIERTHVLIGELLAVPLGDLVHRVSLIQGSLLGQAVGHPLGDPLRSHIAHENPFLRSVGYRTSIPPSA